MAATLLPTPVTSPKIKMRLASAWNSRLIKKLPMKPSFHHDALSVVVQCITTGEGPQRDAVLLPIPQYMKREVAASCASFRMRTPTQRQDME